MTIPKPLRFWLVVALLFVGVGVWRALHYSGEIGSHVILGWIGFLFRVLPDVQFRGDGAVMFVIFLAAALVLGHVLLRWIYRETRSPAEKSNGGWRFRWTVNLLALIVLMFVAGIAMIGVAHQAVWLARTEESLFGKELPHSGERSEYNLKGMAIAIHNSMPGRGQFPTQTPNRKGEKPHSWVTHILPYMFYYTEEPLDFQREWDDPVNAPVFKRIIPVMINPQFRAPPLRNQRGFALNHYAGNRRIFDRREPLRWEDVDHGASNTLMIGEVNQRFVAWGRPQNSRDPAHGINTKEGFGGPLRSGGAWFVMADGSTRFISEDIDRATLSAMATPAGND